MYYATKRKNNTTRMIGLATVAVVNAGAAIAIMNGFGSVQQKEKVESEVVMIEEQKEEEEPPPPPPPIDVDLPPPPPMAVLPDFVAERPPEVQTITPPLAKEPPRVADAKPPPPKPPAPVYPPVRPRADPDKFAKLMTDDYPTRALRAKQEGDVTVSMCMSVDGRASDVKVVKSSGVDSLDQAAVQGMGKLRFTPAKDSAGKPVAWCPPTYPPYQMTIVWKLPKD